LGLNFEPRVFAIAAACAARARGGGDAQVGSGSRIKGVRGAAGGPVPFTMSKCEEEALWSQQQQTPATKTSRHLSWLLLGLCIGTLLVAALAAVEVAALRAEQSRLRADLDDLARRLHDDPQLEEDIRRFQQEVNIIFLSFSLQIICSRVNYFFLTGSYF